MLKGSGDLYSSFAASRSIDCRDISHVGDNYTSDVRNARRAGVAAQLFTEAQPNRFEKLLFERAGRNDIASVIAGAARAARLSFDKNESGLEGLIVVSAGVAGPLLTAFIFWLLLAARQDGVRRLFFLARDGQILSRVALKVAAWANINIECRYLLGSRQAFYLPSLPPDPVLAIDYALAQNVGKCVGQFLAELEFDERSVSNILVQQRLSSGQVIGPDTSEHLRSVLSTPSRSATWRNDRRNGPALYTTIYKPRASLMALKRL